MEYTLEDKYRLINKEIITSISKNPIEIITYVMKMNFINIHGPEHHYLDGACFLVSYKNAGGIIDINKALDELAKRSVKMPGAMCGYFGVCGATTSVGAALSIINNTTPLSSNSFYKDNMEYTSSVIRRMSEIGGPRCCKRNAFLALSYAVIFVKEKYNINMEMSNINCDFSNINKQCIGVKCPFFKKGEESFE